jgi:peroxiredoxin
VQLQKGYLKFKDAGIEILAIVAGSPEDAQKAKKLSGASFELRADESGQMMDRFGLRDIAGNPFTGEDVARAATLLVSRHGKLLWAKYAENYRVRMKVDQLLLFTQKVLSAQRQSDR